MDDIQATPRTTGEVWELLSFSQDYFFSKVPRFRYRYKKCYFWERGGASEIVGILIVANFRRVPGSKKASKELRDQDYWNKLSAEEREYLYQFNAEFYENSFSEDCLHNTTKKRECYRGDNARRRDIWNGAKRVNLEDLTTEERERFFGETSGRID